MYEHLRDASYASTKQLARYATLLQGSLNEHYYNLE